MKALHFAAFAKFILPLGDEPNPIMGFKSLKPLSSGNLVANINFRMYFKQLKYI